jgi:hypothetical protein
MLYSPLDLLDGRDRRSRISVISVMTSPYSSCSTITRGLSLVWAACSGDKDALLRPSSCARDELMLTICRLRPLGVLRNPLLLRPLSSDNDREPRSVPPSETECTVDSCELHWCGYSFMWDRSGLVPTTSAHEFAAATCELRFGTLTRAPLPAAIAREASCWLRILDIEVNEPVRSDSLEPDLKYRKLSCDLLPLGFKGGTTNDSWEYLPERGIWTRDVDGEGSPRSS